MKKSALIGFLTCLLLAVVCHKVSASAVTARTKITETDVCSVLKDPQAFVNKVIRLRGSVYLGEDHMNVSDRACPGRGIELMIKTEAALHHKDIHHFYVQMNHQGRKGLATITGLFETDPHPVSPYVLNIQYVKDIAPDN
jgi:hypothetical protein